MTISIETYDARDKTIQTTISGGYAIAARVWLLSRKRQAKRSPSVPSLQISKLAPDTLVVRVNEVYHNVEGGEYVNLHPEILPGSRVAGSE